MGEPKVEDGPRWPVFLESRRHGQRGHAGLEGASWEVAAVSISWATGLCPSHSALLGTTPDSREAPPSGRMTPCAGWGPWALGACGRNGVGGGGWGPRALSTHLQRLPSPNLPGWPSCTCGSPGEMHPLRPRKLPELGHSKCRSMAEHRESSCHELRADLGHFAHVSGRFHIGSSGRQRRKLRQRKSPWSVSPSGPCEDSRPRPAWEHPSPC